jgi:protease-4
MRIEVMSDAPTSEPVVNPPRPRVAPPPPPRRSGGSTVLGIFLGLSLGLNCLGLGGICLAFLFSATLAGSFGTGLSERSPLNERHYSGDKSASDKIAIVQIDGILMEGLMQYTNRQIEQAAKDKKVKAVVVRINSPGGTITESDQVYHRLTELRDGKEGNAAKPLVVSMGSIAASGGYYIAMPAKILYAERTTLTGSIGVYASFFNVKELTDNVGIHMNLIKAGRVKDSGSPFQDMKPDERHMWQQMVNHAYDQFKDIVEKGRPALKGKLEERVINETVKVSERVATEDNGKKIEKDVEKEVLYVRQRADGGIWTADKALEYGLIDKIGYVEDAIQEAAQTAGLEKYAAILYDKPLSLFDLFGGGIKAPERPLGLDPTKLGSALAPRLWFMAPQSELAGIFSTMGR